MVHDRSARSDFQMTTMMTPGKTVLGAQPQLSPGKAAEAAVGGSSCGSPQGARRAVDGDR